MSDNSDTELCNMKFLCVFIRPFYPTHMTNTNTKTEENFPSPPFTCSPQPTYTLYI